MRLVFPTDWSPSNTIFVRFGGADEKSAVTGEEAESDIGTRRSAASNNGRRLWSEVDKVNGHVIIISI